MNKTASTHKKWLDSHGQWAHFTHRDSMRARIGMAKAHLPEAEAVPATPLPVDCTGNGACVWPMDDNDKFGICGPAMCDHMDGIRSFGQGKPGFTQVMANLAALLAQYEKVSGGDNGTDETMLVGSGGIWMPGQGIAGDPSCVVVDHLDVDVTNVALAQYVIDQFYGICMAWSVPDAFLNGFAQGTVWSSAGVPDPNNGHYTPLSDVGTDGFYRLITWGAWCWASPTFVASVDPQCFITFSALQFNKSTGYDSHGRHVTTQAAAWVAIGGNASLVNAVAATFPPPGATPPAPVPVPTPSPTPTPAPVAAEVTLEQVTAWAQSGLAGHFFVTGSQAERDVAAALAANWPSSGRR